MGSLRNGSSTAPTLNFELQTKTTIGYAGLSHLGLVSGICTAAKGFPVVLYDARADLIADLRKKKLPVHEPELDQLLANHEAKITFTSAKKDLARCQVVVVAIDIPTNSNNESDLGALDQLVDSIVNDLANDSILVLLSQVRPGYTRNLGKRLQPILDKKNVQLFYQVETLIFGQAVNRALHPERYMVGCPNPDRSLPAPFAEFLGAFQCPILPMRYESAELAKISINIFLTASVTATNTLAEICEHIGADWGEIMPALKLDKRIGPHAYLAPGLGISGGNLERDLVTVQSLAAEHGADAQLIQAFRNLSVYRRDWALRTVHEYLPTNRQPVVAVWGLAYKPNTHSVKNSPSLALIQSLKGMKVQAYDPQVKLDGVEGVSFVQCDSPLDVCSGADVLVLMTPWAEFKAVDLAAVARSLKGRVVVDPFGSLDGSKLAGLRVTYRKLGYSNAHAA